MLTLNALYLERYCDMQTDVLVADFTCMLWLLYSWRKCVPFGCLVCSKVIGALGHTVRCILPCAQSNEARMYVRYCA